MDRAAWKRRNASKGLPPGERMVCRCGGLLVFEQGLRSVILHHAEPWCARFREVCGQAEFWTLAASTPAEVQAAIEQAQAKHGR